MNFLSKIPLSTKIPAIIVGLGLIGASSVSVTSYLSARDNLTTSAEQKLTAILEDRHTSLESWFASIESDLRVQSENPAVLAAVKEFSSAWNLLGSSPKSYLQRHYIHNNPNPTGSKENLDFASDGSLYSNVHAVYHPFFKTLLRDRGYYDIFLFNTQGDLIYSVYKELDYATNIVNGEWSSSDLGAAFVAAKSSGQQKRVSFFDFKAYGPSNGAAASFISIPLLGENGAFTGVLAFQMPTGRLNELMMRSSGLGETGHTYFVGEDKLMRNDTHLREEPTLLLHSVDNEAVESALDGKTGTIVTSGFSGEKSLTSYAPLTFQDRTWALVAEQTLSEATAASRSLLVRTLIQLGVICLLLVSAGIYFGRNISVPIVKIGDAIARVGRRDKNIEIPYTSRNDEIGAIATSLRQTEESLSEAANIARTAIFKQTAFDESAKALMLVDRDFAITHINDTAKSLLAENEAEFRTIWPSFQASSTIGSTVDIFDEFSKDKRNLINDPANLPFGTALTVGETKFMISVSGVFNEDGEYAGNVLDWEDITVSRTNAGIISAIDKTEAVIEFDRDGKVLNANQNFLAATGYQLSEIVGQHHHMFADKDYAASDEYRSLWEALRRGEGVSGTYKQTGRDAKELWLHATYSPIVDDAGNVFKVVAIASDITEQKLISNENSLKINAISRSQAVIEFELDSSIINANENFLETFGYSLDEISGQKHALFVDEDYRKSNEYHQFWDALRRGERQEGRFERKAKGGQDIWIVASYNPILDLNGNPYKIIKYAYDVTQAELDRRKSEQERQQRSAEQERVTQTLAEGLEKLSVGNLTASIDAEYPAEYEQLRTDFNLAVIKLKEVMSTLTESANGIERGVSEISQGSDDLSKRTENQAASLEQTAAALNQATTAVDETASAAKHANDIVSNTRTEATESGEIVREAVNAMSEIERSSGEINQIISVIDEIAFQTNLLALNAGVEAARAGEAGRGFAVVASEVRALAQRSSDAAKEIKQLISASTQHVDSGVELVGKAGGALENIVARVAEVSDLVSNISSSAQEQSRGLGEINSAVNQMDQVTQQNAAMVEESTAASHALKQEANELIRMVSHFSIGDASASPIPQSTPTTSNVAQQQRRVATFAMDQGNTALKLNGADSHDDWAEF
ncbi:MAG: methyl-accepting chemotaxis protein [Cyanobacteria bacterium P01_F01_bin.3]